VWAGAGRRLLGTGQGDDEVVGHRGGQAAAEEVTGSGGGCRTRQWRAGGSGSGGGSGGGAGGGSGVYSVVGRVKVKPGRGGVGTHVDKV
jgi:hypothetical protein